MRGGARRVVSSGSQLPELAVLLPHFLHLPEQSIFCWALFLPSILQVFSVHSL